MPALIPISTVTPVEAVGRGDHGDQALGQHDRSGRILDAGDHREFVAPEPGHHVVAAHVPPQPLGHRPQQGIAHRVAEAVVDRLETGRGRDRARRPRVPMPVLGISISSAPISRRRVRLGRSVSPSWRAMWMIRASFAPPAR
jgi:hypothetical protein